MKLRDRWLVPSTRNNIVYAMHKKTRKKVEKWIFKRKRRENAPKKHVYVGHVRPGCAFRLHVKCDVKLPIKQGSGMKVEKCWHFIGYLILSSSL